MITLLNARKIFLRRIETREKYFYIFNSIKTTDGHQEEDHKDYNIGEQLEQD
jgi:hypothetical protein